MKNKRILLYLAIILVFGSVSYFSVRYFVVGRPIVVYGDTRTDHDMHRKVVNAIIKTRPKAVFHTGDLVDDGREEEQWEIFNEIVRPLRRIARFYPALGNHENDSSLYFKNFNLPGNERWYKVIVDGIYFIILDSNYEMAITREQYRWLENALRTIDEHNCFIIVIYHHPIFSSGNHLEDEKNWKDIVVPLFEKHGVDIVFNGHEHNYERLFKDGVYYIVTGGGGAELDESTRNNDYSVTFKKDYHFCRLKVRGDKLKVDVLDIDLKPIDMFEIIL